MKAIVIFSRYLSIANCILNSQSNSTTSRKGKNTLKISVLLFAFILTMNSSCNKVEQIQNIVPTCEIISPYEGYITEQGALISILADANDKDGQISEILYLIDGISIGSSFNIPYNFSWDTQLVDTGYHIINVTVKDNMGSAASDEIKIYLTEVGNSLAHPLAAFSANETEISTGSAVQFTDLSTNLPNDWLWDFGDGSTSALQNPVHTYSFADQYTVKLSASNQYGTGTENKEQYITVAELETGTVADYEGNIYKTVKIGNQWWMAENLKTAHFDDGTEIPLVESNNEWSNLDYSDKAYCYYDNSLENVNIYGALYTWAAAMNGATTSELNPSDVQGICPCNWHLPSDAEWIELEMQLGMSFSQADAFGWRGTNEGDKMKTTSGWYNGGNGSNSSGFSALSGGQRTIESFRGITELTIFWSSTEYINITYLAFNRTLSYQNSGVGWFRAQHFYGYPKNYGFSVRCVKD